MSFWAVTVHREEDMNQDKILEYVEPIFRFCRKRVNNTQDAEDLAGDIILHILDGMHRTNIHSLDAWVWRVARNRYARFIRIQTEKSVLLPGDEYFADNSNLRCYDTYFEASESNEDMSSDVFKLLHTLSAEYRDIFVDHYLGGKSIRDLSAFYSLPETTIKWRLNVGRKRIRERIGEQSLEERVYKRVNWNTGTCNGSMDPDRYLHTQLSRAICLAAYRKPVTVEEISLATGIPAIYIEDEIPRLLFGDALSKIGKKYATDFLILSLEEKKKLAAVPCNPVTALADFFLERFAQKEDEVKALPFYGNEFGMNRLGHIAISYVLRNMIRRAKASLGLEDGPFPVRQDGGYGWYVVEETENAHENMDEMETGCNCAINTGSNSNEAAACIYYYWVAKYYDYYLYHNRGICWLSENNIVQGSEKGVIIHTLEQEDAAMLIRNSLIIKRDGDYLLNFPSFDRDVFLRFISLFSCDDARLTEQLASWIRSLRNEFARFTPGRLDAQINQWVGCYANRIVGFVINELIRYGALYTPIGDKPLTGGVFCVKGPYIGSI